MNWFYAIDDQQSGPVSDLQLNELLSSGKIGPDTPVWREGMADWQPLKAARPVSIAPPPVPSLQGGVCAECGRSFPPGELIPLNRSWVCAQCKPIFLQRMSEGADPSGAAGGLWRTAKQLVTQSGTPFPDRCVKCNAPVTGYRLKRVLYWQHPAYYLLILINLLVCLIVVMIVRKKAILNVGVCETHRAVRRRAIVIGWIGGLGGPALAIGGGIALQSWWPVLFGTLVFFAAIIYAAVKAPMVSAAKITGENVWLKGVHRDFLAGLPEWPGV
jgi:DNA-directed RNA polymerase subunit RPC12/RpoP